MRYRSSRVRAGLKWLLIGFLLAGGLRLAASWQARVLVRAPLVGANLVQSGLIGRDDGRWPRYPEDRPGATATAPPGVLPAGYGFGSVTRGQNSYAAAGGPLDEDGNIARPAVFLFDLAWHQIGKVSGLDFPSGTWWAWSAWDSGGRKLGIIFHDRGRSWREVVGVVEPPSLRFRVLFRDVYSGDIRGLAWAGSGLVLAYSNRLVLVDIASGAKRDLYADPSVPAPRHGHIWSVLGSPHGSYIAFARMPVPMSGSQSGLWMVDVTSGKCSEVTYERLGWYHHDLLYWDSPKTLLFSRKTDFGRYYSIYRASVR